MRNIFAALAVVALFTLAGCAVGENREFWGAASEVGDDVAKILIENSICESALKKCAGHVYAIDPFTGGFEFSVYGVTDAAVLKEIQNTLKNKFDQTPEMKRMVVSFYKGETTDTGRFIRRKSLISREKFRR